MKTGSLFAAAAELGAVLNKADAETTRALKNFGSKIGAAYQIYDDCLDIAGNETEIGKTLGTDLRKGKMTLPILMLLRSAPAEERERYSELILAEERRHDRQAAQERSPERRVARLARCGRGIASRSAGRIPRSPHEPIHGFAYQLGDALREMLDQFRV